MNIQEQQKIYNHIIQAYESLCQVEPLLDKHDPQKLPLWAELYGVTQSLLRTADSPYLEKANKHHKR